MSDKYFLSIGLHKSCHIFRFHGIAYIPSNVFHTFCFIYPALSGKYFVCIGLQKTCIIFRFHVIANIPSFVFHTSLTNIVRFHGLKIFCFHRTYNFFEKVNCQNFIHCTDPVLSPGLKPQVKIKQ